MKAFKKLKVEDAFTPKSESLFVLLDVIAYDNVISKK